MKIKEIIDALERFAPLPLQDGFDNAGLQLGLTGAEAMQVFNRYGVLEYLQEFFDVLHSQSSQWILADIDEYINIRKKEEES